MAYKRADKRAQRRARILRWVILGVVLVGMTALITAHHNVRGVSRPAGVDALCPFGGVETLYSLLTGGDYVRRTAAASVILLVGMVAMALAYRRSFCGQLCPLGTLQGLFGALGRRIFASRPIVPPAVDRVARLLKYVVLLVFALWTWRAAELVMRPYDPWAAWAHLTSPRLLTELGIGLVVLIAALVGSLAYERFFCKYLCPTGALLGLLSKVSVLRIRRSEATCIDCGLCNRACPMNVQVSAAETVTSSECISCNECVNACPVADTLYVAAPGNRRPSAALASGLVVALMAGIVGMTTLTGDFAWFADQSGGRGGRAGRGEGGSLQSHPTGIRGSMSMREIADATGIPVAELAAAFGVPLDEADQPLRELKDRYGFRPADVAAWVEERLRQ